MPDPILSTQYDLLARVAHNLKNPLAAVKSYADLVQQEGGLTERQDHYLGRIQSVVEQMTLQVNELVSLVWLESGVELVREPVSIVDIVRAQMRTLDRIAAQRDIRMSLVTTDDLVSIRVDGTRLGQAIINLLSNAIKYNNQHGTVQVSLHRAEDAIILTVRDNGHGIPAEDLPHVFDQFYRSRQHVGSPIEGSGLGLSIAKDIVEKHNGTISVESRPGEGSTFTMTLPIE